MQQKITIDHKANRSTQWFTQLCLILFCQSIFYGSFLICIYALLTLNIKLIIFLLTVSISQSFVKRSSFFIKLVNYLTPPIDYFKTFKRIYQQQIPQQQSSMFCFHPHSVLPYGFAANMNADNSKMSKFTGIGTRVLKYLPFVGLQIRLWGVETVDAQNMTRLMKQKKNIGITPGGYQQGIITTPKQIRIYIENRKGFIKYALQYGYTIRPVLVYNQHKAFWTWDVLRNLRVKIYQLTKIPPVVFIGFLWVFLPLNIDLVTIVGKQIKRKIQNKNKQVTRQQVNEIHEKYKQQFIRMHKKYKNQYNETEIKFY